MANIYNTKLTNTTLPSNYSISGSNGYTTTVNTVSLHNGANSTFSITQPYEPVMHVAANSNTIEVKGNMVLNGLDLEERLNIIERVLMIPERDATIEAKYPSLKKKFDEYISTLEKYKTFERIKGE